MLRVFSSSPRRPIAASLYQLKQRFPSRLTLQFPNEELNSLRVEDRKVEKNCSQSPESFDPAGMLKTALLIRDIDLHSAKPEISARNFFLCASFALFAALR